MNGLYVLPVTTRYKYVYCLSKTTETRSLNAEDNDGSTSLNICVFAFMRLW